jgi:RNA polymerase sigma-70 factor (ECF subfamily)
MADEVFAWTDADALARIFNEEREALARCIALRLDRRLAARVDVADLVQETFLEAARRLQRHEPPDMPPALWLRWLAREQVLMCHRKHFGDKRAIAREMGPLPLDSSAQFIQGIIGREPSPSQHLRAEEAAERLRLALAHLDDEERDLILWRHFEQLGNRDVARLLEIGEAAASKRYVRALERLRAILLAVGISGS